ncbi:tRNA (adenosine(37)-N6)-threonylcarbamoyltransferase complex ATPase subunit type 1 TsaE [Natronincola ferrireducens]|uniref:tRNA threonylcarbamoyladenosine biosynthesis protein TsaE n=1 Tax=Natronincola ferrireducens TaxID=393762 RepID=A0A1G8XSK2_9FIRM|nr:tRNA (adenosine(37)-N6)-threonylcarbamoyltransferase complex ATPase subunit type 1 TsaE [Natronincola ferrireducens]SDJ93531.1 tRNA threonylcarbamoyladenosine biosynthesis protein TsaE [Natronincola ferrireducens]
MKCVKALTEKETEALGIKLGSLMGPGDVLCLIGDLGAGKTTFTKAFAIGLDIMEDVTSPTFTIVQEYEGRIPLYHFDVYRVSHVREMEDIPYEEYFYGDGVCVIEWAHLIEEVLPKDYLKIEIKYIGPQEREICFQATNAYYEKQIEELLQ